LEAIAVPPLWVDNADVGRSWIIAILCAGCGRFGFVDVPPMAVTNAPPQVCQNASWTFAVPDPKVELAVASTPSGVAATWAPLAGGNLMGAQIDATMQMTAAPRMVKGPSQFTSKLTYLEGSLVAAPFDGF
jgi:hypothetical protein